MADQAKKTRKKFKTAGVMRQFMSDYYLGLDHASRTGDSKIAWCTSVGPAEILRGMGFLVYYPETHSAMLGATRTATDFIPHANALGYAPEICSYLTADIGAYTQGVTPLTRAYGIESIPRADVLVFNTNQCRDVQDWFAWYAREFEAPLIGVHTYRGIAEVTESHAHSIAKQMEDLIEPLEKVSGTKFDMDQFRQAVALSRECSTLWKQVLDTAAASPSPLTFFDGTTLMGPAVVGRGTQEAVDYYKLLLDELEERVEMGVGAVDGERFRIYWEGMPIWGRLRAHSELFAELDACVLASTYCNSWVFSDLDPEDPFVSMARAYTRLFIVRSDEIKEQYISEMLDFFAVDGIVYHNARTCPNNSNSNYGMPQRLSEKTGIPSLVIDGDLNDLRCLSDEQTNTNIEAFIEQLEESGG
jgi:benzoyl-CoA reductase/2-hydroxyglutaryl-CoA dehydratase subunit BcrC/BadD/HgdB